MNGLPASSRHKPRETDEAVLLIYSAERSVEEITDFLGIKPTPRRGGRLRTDSMRRPLPPTGWFLSSKGEVDSGDVVDHLDWLIRRLANVETRLLELQAERGTKMGVVSCCDGDVGDATLLPRQMAALARLNLECAFDFHFVRDA